MPWRKYPSKQGTYGPIYDVASGVTVRKDRRSKWTIYINKNGRRKSKSFDGGDREHLVKAIRAAEAVAAKIDNWGAKPEPEKKPERNKMPLFKDYSQRWLELNSSKWSPFTVQRYEQVLNDQLWPYAVFAKPIDTIGRKDIKSHLRTLTRTLAPNTVELVHCVISGVFNEAIDEELLVGNPASGLLKSILPPINRRKRSQPDPFNRQELKRFLGCAESMCDPVQVMILKAMAYGGFRLGEVLAMRAEHLNLEQRTYYVAQSYKGQTFGQPKAGKCRLVDLPDFLIAQLSDYLHWLRKQRLKDGRGGPVDYLFIDAKASGGRWPYSQRKVQGLVKRVCRDAGLRVRHPHDLRHSYATLLLMAHQSPGYVQKQLGHSSISITMDVYCHWIPGEGRGGLEAALGGGDEVVSGVPNGGATVHISAYKQKGLQ